MDYERGGAWEWGVFKTGLVFERDIQSVHLESSSEETQKLTRSRIDSFFTFSFLGFFLPVRIILPHKNTINTLHRLSIIFSNPLSRIAIQQTHLKMQFSIFSSILLLVFTTTTFATPLPLKEVERKLTRTFRYLDQYRYLILTFYPLKQFPDDHSRRGVTVKYAMRGIKGRMGGCKRWRICVGIYQEEGIKDVK